MLNLANKSQKISVAANESCSLKLALSNKTQNEYHFSIHKPQQKYLRTLNRLSSY